MVADAAIIVCEPTPERAMTLAPLFKLLDDSSIPHMLFVNKIDHTELNACASVLEALQAVSERPLVLRQLPIMRGREDHRLCRPGERARLSSTSRARPPT